jgi:sarcosine/dimethylglycine N-methyltransferase
VRQDDRAPFARALERARAAAYPPGEYVGQESFMLAREILALARRAGVRPGVRVLDLCCGTAGPGRIVTERTSCWYLGVDCSVGAVEIARERTRHLSCSFEVGRVPPVPRGLFDVVLLLETMLAFADKAGLLRGIADALGGGGRLALTFEAGQPLTSAERAAMPDADTVHLLPMAELVALVSGAGLGVTWLRETTASHVAVAGSLLQAYVADAENASALVGTRAVEELLAAHRLWSAWMRSGRVRTFELVARTA